MLKRWIAVPLIGLLMLGSLVTLGSQNCSTALLVIDVQSNLLVFDGPRLQTVFDVPILESIEPIVAAARAANLPIIYSKYVTGAMVATPEFVRFPDSIAPQDGDFVVVRSDVHPLDAVLVELLTEEGISQLIVCGLYSTCCIDNAVSAADDLGYEVIVLEEGHADYVENRAKAITCQENWEDLAHVTVAQFADIDMKALCRP